LIKNLASLVVLSDLMIIRKSLTILGHPIGLSMAEGDRAASWQLSLKGTSELWVCWAQSEDRSFRAVKMQHSESIVLYYLKQKMAQNSHTMPRSK